MVKNDFANFTPQPRRHIAGPGFFNFIKFSPQPILAFRIPLAGMNMNRLMTFV
jgi:hypothetical protein